jgi:transposase
MQSVKVRKQPRIHEIKPYRTLKESDVERIVKLRFRSLTDFSTYFMTYAQLSKTMHIPVSTCHYAIKSFIRQGADYVHNRRSNCRPKSSFKIKTDVATYLRAHQTLQSWSGLTLHQRCKQLQRQMGVKLSISGLRSFYYRNGIKNLVCSYSYQ